MTDLQHALDGRDAANWIFRERPTVGERPDEPPIHVDRASAHARDDPRVLQSDARHAREDQVLFGRETLQEPDDLDIEFLDSLSVAQVGHAVALHSGDDLLDRQDRGGLRRGDRGREGERREQDSGERGQEAHVKHNVLLSAIHSL